MTEQLPIYNKIGALQDALSKNNLVVLQAAPGAGKSTVLPLHLLNQKWLEGKKIIMLQPRRLAVKTIATRLAQQLDEVVGETIGYRIRFENKISSKTKIEVVTEGILMRMLQHDNSLKDVGLVIFDEFHERSLHADVSLALCREVQSVLRDDLKLLIMSATLDVKPLFAQVGYVPFISCEGRQYPVKVKHVAEDKSKYLTEQVADVICKAISEEQGDVLVFLPGSGEIKKVNEILNSRFLRAIVYSLYGDLSFDEQQKAILPNSEGRRKIVLSTSIAETSLTIEGVRVVIDSGYSRLPKYDPESGLTRLETVKVTKDAAIQRAGRAGRLEAGVCYRLWAAAYDDYLQPARIPEILQSDLSTVILELSNWGLTSFYDLPWITPPPRIAVTTAVELLESIGAIRENQITNHGKQILQLGLHPRLGHMLLFAKENGLLTLAIDIASILEEKDFLQKSTGTNLSLRVQSLRKYRLNVNQNADRNILKRVSLIASTLAKQFLTSLENNLVIDSDVGLLVSKAYPERIAKKEKNFYRLSGGGTVTLSDDDELINEEWLAIAHLHAGKTHGKIFLAASLDSASIEENVKSFESIYWDYQNGILTANEEKKIGDIVLSKKPLRQLNNEHLQSVLSDVIKKEGLHILNFTEECDQLLARYNSVREWENKTEWPFLKKDTLSASIDEWLTPFLLNIKRKDDFKKLNIYDLLINFIGWDRVQELDNLAPEKLSVPSGSDIKIQYSESGASPVIAVRLQEMFGLADTPKVDNGKVKITLHLLSPGYKPVQVTQDLKSFWNNTYQIVRKELRVRYQKHSWPEDPWTAEAVRGVKRKNL